jgi:hypothetical protein
MINLFYEPGYAKRKKKIFTFKFSSSVLLNKLIDLAYFLNFPIPETFITNGPHKLMNNIVKIFFKNSQASFNKILYKNNYILQFDKFGENKLKEIIKQSDENTKVLVGPLYTIEHLKRLLKYVRTYQFIKVMCCSTYAKDSLINDLKLGFLDDDIVVLPIGIKSHKELTKIKKQIRNDKCLIYYKNRDLKDLNLIKDFLNSRGINYDLLEYGKYNNSYLNKTSQNNKFGILLASTESQGFAIQEIMSNNLPLLVWDKNYGEFEGIKIRGTSVTVWNNDCGLVVNSYKELEDRFDLFLNNLNKFNPKKIVFENLSYESFVKNLEKKFLNF